MPCLGRRCHLLQVNYYVMFKRFFSFLLMALTFISVFAQEQITVTGTVIAEEDGQPIIGCSVLLQGTTNVGTTTDIDGHFSLKVPANGTLVFSYVGMNNETIKINNQKSFFVRMRNTYFDIEETVVVAYGVQSKRTLTTSIASVKADEIKDEPVNSVDQALQGRATGVSMITPSAGVGEAPVIRVRGVSSITSGTSPLYIIDGVPVESTNGSYAGNSNPIADLNPSDILSMDVLKDAASAALYGSRAANGVIMITTKQGSKGKTKVSYNGMVAVSKRSNFWEVMNAQQYTDFKNMAVKNRWGTENYDIANNAVLTDGRKAFNLMHDSKGNVIDTKWEDEIFQTGIQTTQSVSLEGGTDKAQFFLSGNYNSQKGVVKGDEYKRFGLQANGRVKATDWLTVGGSISTSNSKTRYTDRSRRGGQYATEGFPRMGLILPTNLPAWDEDGLPHLEDGWIGQGNNTVFNGYSNPAGLLYYGSNITAEILRFLGNAYAEIKPFSGFTIKTQFGMDYNNITDYNFYNSIAWGDTENGQVSNTSTKRTRQTWTNTLNYVFSFGKNNFDLLLGQENSRKYMNRWGAQRTNLLDTFYDSFQGSWGSSTVPAGAQAISENTLLSFMGRINYDFDTKYLLSINFRRDGFSALSKDNRWGNFGGVSAAWRISSESFMKPLSGIINDLKIKASYGIVGNTSIADYASHSLYASAYYGSDGAYTLSQIADKNLKWESSKKFDIGFNASFIKRIDVEFDYYKNVSDDLILSVPVSHSAGIPGNAITANAGSMENSGIEFNISAKAVKTKDFSWTTSFNITTTHNEVTSLGEGITELTSGSYNITKVGESIGHLYLFPTNGVDKETGRRIFIDEDGKEALLLFEKTGRFFYRDGTPCPESKIKQVDAGNTQATFYGGWNNKLSYKNIDLSIFFQFSGGNKLFNGMTATASDMRYWNNTIDVLNNYWTPEHKNAKYPIPVYGDNYSNGSSKPITDWVEEADYIRLKSVSLGYTFNTKKWSKKLGITALRVYAQAQNLFTITGYSGLDPEASLYGNSSTASYANLQAGVDKNTMPQARTFTLGLNVSF